jgi:S1-C subfamily serine protease
VTRGLPAALAGVQAGDMLLAINGAQVNYAQEAVDRIAALPHATEARFTLLRSGNQIELALTPRF